MRSDRRILALLSARTEHAEPVREALARIDPHAQLATDVFTVVEAVRSSDVDVVICDDQAADPRLVYAGVAEAARDREAGAVPSFVTILAPGHTSTVALDREPAFTHFLARPFRAEALTALVRSLVEDPSVTVQPDEAQPAVHVRRPARFSARPLYAEAVAFAREAFVGARDGQEPDMARARMVAERIHTSMLQSNLLLNRALEPYKRFEIPTHCANVAIFAAKIAMSRDMSLDETLRVIQAGLVHDMGMARLPESILFKEGALTEEERAVMEQHPLLGAEIVSRLGTEFAWLQRAIRQEHERIDGSGYPDSLRRDSIDPIARILGVADVFEAFSHSRAYRSPFTAFEALERVVQMRGEVFDGEIVDALANEISVFPLDSYVKLSSGAIGRVVATNPDNLMRPTIEVLWNESWRPIEPRVVSLDDVPDIAIERPLHESEVPIT
ncbi:MAG: HD-GYP domain-containing protein [Gemmatimonadota bacterium]|nr:HD-GYP domain-containing protein [Gemmatimonadota bacterium]